MNKDNAIPSTNIQNLQTYNNDITHTSQMLQIVRWQPKLH